MQKRTIQSRTKQGHTVEPKQECRSFTQPWLYTKNLSEFCHVLNQLYQSNLPATMRSSRENDLIKKQGHPKYICLITRARQSSGVNSKKVQFREKHQRLKSKSEVQKTLIQPLRLSYKTTLAPHLQLFREPLTVKIVSYS